MQLRKAEYAWYSYGDPNFRNRPLIIIIIITTFLFKCIPFLLKFMISYSIQKQPIQQSVLFDQNPWFSFSLYVLLDFPWCFLYFPICFLYFTSLFPLFFLYVSSMFPLCSLNCSFVFLYFPSIFLYFPSENHDSPMFSLRPEGPGSSSPCWLAISACHWAHWGRLLFCFFKCLFSVLFV